LVVNVLQIFLFEGLGVPFWLTALVILLMVLLYTFEGGVKTIVITDTLQTSFMIISLVGCIVYILSHLNLTAPEAFDILASKNYTHFINTDINSKTFFLKTILGGMFITIAMTGLDQEMMQKTFLSTILKIPKKICSLSREHFGGEFGFSIFRRFTLSFCHAKWCRIRTFNRNSKWKRKCNEYFGFKDAAGNVKNIMGDDLFPALSLQGYFPFFISIIFIIGLISALFPSADGALTAVTSSYCVDLLNLNEDQTKTEKQKKN
jgi:Na+/pantothenate symporter